MVALEAIKAVCKSANLKKIVISRNILKSLIDIALSSVDS